MKIRHQIHQAGQDLPGGSNSRQASAAGKCAALPTLPALTSLHLAPHLCNAAAAAAVMTCPHLRELVLGRYTDYQLPQLPPGALSQLTRLRCGTDGPAMP